MKLVVDHPSATIGTGVCFLILFAAALVYSNTMPRETVLVNLETGERLTSQQFAERQNPFLLFCMVVSGVVIILGFYGQYQHKIQKVK